MPRQRLMAQQTISDHVLKRIWTAAARGHHSSLWSEPTIFLKSHRDYSYLGAAIDAFCWRQKALVLRINSTHLSLGIWSLYLWHLWLYQWWEVGNFNARSGTFMSLLDKHVWPKGRTINMSNPLGSPNEPMQPFPAQNSLLCKSKKISILVSFSSHHLEWIY